MTEKEKMLAGKLYDPSDKELSELRIKTHKLSKMFNDTFEDEEEKRAEIIRELVPDMGENGGFMGPVYFDYGVFTHIGKRFFANFNLILIFNQPTDKSSAEISPFFVKLPCRAASPPAVTFLDWSYFICRLCL